MLAAILIIIAASVSLSVVILLILYYIGKRPDAEQVQGDDSRYYDENGNHLYYDRKLIARLEKEQERAAQQNK